MKLDTQKVRILMVKQRIYSQAELARRIEVTRGAVHLLMHGISSPSMETLGKLCNILACTPNDILVSEDVAEPA